MINWWKSIDTVQKIIFLAGGLLTVGIVAVYIPKVTGNAGPDIMEEKDSTAVSTTDFDINQKVDESKINYRKNTLDAIRERQDLLRKKEEKNEKYGFDDSYFKSEFNIDSTETVEASITDPKPQEEPKQTYVAKREVVYVEAPVEEPVEQAKPVLSRQKRLGSSDANTSSINNKVFFNAVVHGDHTVRDRELITLRLTEPLEYNGISMPKNSYVRGTVNYNRNRLDIDIRSIGQMDLVNEVKVKVYDKTDRNEGIPVNQLGSQELKQDVSSEVVQDVARDINLPGARSLTRSSKRAIQDERVNILNGHKVLIGFEQ